jgi:hypothetical protein
VNFASSDGWNESMPKRSHRREPLTVLPTPGTRVAASRSREIATSPITTRWSSSARWSTRIVTAITARPTIAQSAWRFMKYAGSLYDLRATTLLELYTITTLTIRSDIIVKSSLPS